MLTDWARRFFRRVLEPIAGFFNRIGLSPNHLTLLGMALQTVVGIVLALGQLRLGGVLLIFFSAFDSLDGTLARMTGKTSRFGAFFDATTDRFAEAVVLFGLLIYAATLGAVDQILLIYAGLVGSFLVSYTRAKAESLGVSCKVGILTRAERIALLVVGLVFHTWRPLPQLPDFLTIALWALVVLSWITAIQRVWAVWKATGDERSGGSAAQ